MALLHTAEYRYFVRIEVTPHTRSLSNFSEFTYTVLQAGSISEKSCAQVVATPRYSEPPRKRLTLQSPCHHVVMPVRRTIITSVISILRMICKTQSPLYSIPGSVPRLLHIQNYIQTFRSAKACQKMQRCARRGRRVDSPGPAGARARIRPEDGQRRRNHVAEQNTLRGRT